MAQTTARRAPLKAAPEQEVQTTQQLRYATPLCDVWEGMENATIVVDLPGVAQDGLDLKVEDDLLVLVAHTEAAPAKGRTLYSEWAPTHFHRTFSLSPDVDRERIDARLRHGVLTVTVPKTAESRPRRIQVHAS
jgi:HSP20 family protein